MKIPSLLMPGVGLWWLGLVLSSCAHAPSIGPAPLLTQSQLDGADVGPPPREAEETKVRGFIAKKLRDGALAEFRFGDSARGSLGREGETLFGWQTHVLINAKKRDGGFAGFEPYIFFLRNGEIIAYQDPEAQKTGRWIGVKK